MRQQPLQTVQPMSPKLLDAASTASSRTNGAPLLHGFNVLLLDAVGVILHGLHRLASSIQGANVLLLAANVVQPVLARMSLKGGGGGEEGMWHKSESAENMICRGETECTRVRPRVVQLHG